MCGRNSLFAGRDDLEAAFDARVVADGGYTPRYNVAPGEPLEVVTHEAPDDIDRYRWGFVPPWSDDPMGGIANARAETAAEKEVFRDAWASRPCLVLSSGYYEWKRTGGSKRSYRVYREDAPAFAMAGLWERWEGEDRSVRCVTVLTTEPNDLVDPIHDRMPVVLSEGEEGDWLAAGPDERERRCRPYPGDDLAADEISTRVNDPANDDPSIVEPLGHDQSRLGEY